MKRLIFLNLILLITLSFTLACVRIPPADQGELKTVNLSNLNAIPLTFGSLISVTVPAEKSNWAHLWFQDDDQTIRLVRVGYADNRLHEKVTVIPRN